METKFQLSKKKQEPKTTNQSHSKPVLDVYFDLETFKADETVEEFEERIKNWTAAFKTDYREKLQRKHRKTETLVKPYLFGWRTLGKDYWVSEEDSYKFFDHLRELAKKYKLRVWIFNTMYDIPIMLPYLFKWSLNSRQKYTDDKGNLIEKKLSNIIDTFSYRFSESKTFIEFTFKCKSKRLKFECCDAANWNRHIHSLEKNAIAAGVPKDNLKVKGLYYKKWNAKVIEKEGVIEYEETNLKTLRPTGKKVRANLNFELKYLFKDLRLLEAVVLDQEEQRKLICNDVLPINKVLFRTTSPSFVKAVIDQFFIKKAPHYIDDVHRPILDHPDNEINKAIYDIMANSSKGGFTTCNLKYLSVSLDSPLIKSYDVNSMYPYFMCQGIPKGELAPENQWEECFTWHLCKMSYCRWKEKYKHLSTPPAPKDWCNGKLFFVEDCYYQVIKQRAESDIESIETHYQEKSTELSALLEELVKKKIEYSKVGDKARKNAIKLLLNSLYGKLCEKVYEHHCCYDLEGRCFTKKMLNEDLDNPIEYRNILSGVYVAQAGRAMIINEGCKQIDKGNIVLYMDTDSIKLIENVPFEDKEGELIDSDKLGYFKCEGMKDQDGYTDFRSTGKIKKWCMFNKFEIGKSESIRMGFSGISSEYKKLLLEVQWEPHLLERLFGKDENILVVEAKLSKDRNMYGQCLLTPVNVSSNTKQEIHTGQMELKTNEKGEPWLYINQKVTYEDNEDEE